MHVGEWTLVHRLTPLRPRLAFFCPRVFFCFLKGCTRAKFPPDEEEGMFTPSIICFQRSLVLDSLRCDWPTTQCIERSHADRRKTLSVCPTLITQVTNENFLLKWHSPRHALESLALHERRYYLKRPRFTVTAFCRTVDGSSSLATAPSKFCRNHRP